MKEIGEKQRKLESEAAGPRRAGEFLASEFDRFPPRPMFDAYWREGELALLFGPADAGKSLLAMQVADAIGRGRPIEGFEMPRSRRKVLYLDLKHSDRQFAERYSYWVPVQNIGSVLKGCKFAENLYRSRPRADEELCEWLTRQIGEHGFNVVIIDDLTALKKTHEDVKEALAVMRKLKRLCDEMRVSVLAITGSEGPRAGRPLSEQELKRSSILCSIADTVFAIGRGRANERYIIQTRARNAEIKWNVHNAPLAQIKRMENGWPGFVFDRRFARAVDPELRELICRVRAMRQAGSTWRAVAAGLGIPKSRAERLFQKWTPEMGGEEFAAEYAVPAADKCETEPVAVDGREAEEWEIAGVEKPVWIDIERQASGERSPPPDPPRPYGPERVSVYDLKRGTDGAGYEIFIQSVEEYTGKPNVWYKRDRHGNISKFARKGFGNIVTRLPSEFL